MADEYTRPLPVKQPESDFYWERAQAHELWLRRCNACERAYFYPRDICPHCFSRDVTWVQASGRGTLHTFAVVERAPTPAFADHVPYVAALVDLEEGPRFPTNLVGVDPHSEEHRDRHAGRGRVRGRNDRHHAAEVPPGRLRGSASKRRQAPAAWTAIIRPS